MARGTDANPARSSRSAGLVPLVVGVASAVALTSAAYFTVDSASCSPAQYIRHDNRVELVGGCVDGSELPADAPAVSGGVKHSGYNP